MPRYQFGCPCGLRFERNLPISKSSEPCRCPACDRLANQIPSRVGVSYPAGTGSSQAVPGNSGLTGIDSVADRAIGASAQAGWEVAKKRRQEKLAELAANPEARPEDLRNLQDHYVVMPKDEAAYRDRANQLANPARKALTEQTRS